MQTVIGLFETAAKAQQAAENLMHNGFTSENVDVSTRKNDSNTSSSYATDESPVSVYQDNLSTDMSSNASTTGTLNYPTGNVSGGTSAYGPNPDSLDNHGDHGHEESFGDKVSKFFSNLFGTDDEEANRYSTMANKTGNVVTVHASSQEEAERAADLLDDYGAINVNEDAMTGDSSTSTANSYSNTDNLGNTAFAASYPYSNDDSTNINKGMDLSASDNMDISSKNSEIPPTNKMGYNNSDDEVSDKLNVIKEDVQIGKKQVETGGVRLRSRIVERPVEEQLRLREEKVTVQRTPVDRPATTADFQNFKEGVIEMTEHAEIPEVSKQARIVEEVKLNKEVSERMQNINETARDTEVDIEEIPTSNSSTSTYKKDMND